MERRLSPLDRMITTLDTALRELSASTDNLSGDRESPAANHPEPELSDAEKRHSGGLMRVNHTGEVCAQALYRGQALVATSEETKQALLNAAQEEKDHLDWCAERLEELDSEPSKLNPLFFGTSYAIGAITGAIGDRVSLGFVHATEEGVATHLKDHLKKLPDEDRKSQLILQRMLEEEEHHGQHALDQGGSEFPTPVKRMMTGVSQLMTKTTYWI
jgi:ubiquinone biosynthesis monooxygenase Coq7